jgi:hypothetical protein
MPMAEGKMFCPYVKAAKLHLYKSIEKAWEFVLMAVAINVRFARACEAFIVFDARVSRFSKPAPPARAKRLQWKPAFNAWPDNPLSISIIIIIFLGVKQSNSFATCCVLNYYFVSIDYRILYLIQFNPFTLHY